LVFDSATDPDTVTRYAPVSPRVEVVVTTTDRAFGVLGRLVEVEVFERAESLRQRRSTSGGGAAGRWYTTTLASDVAARDGIGLELDDVAPAPGRGLILEAFHDDTTREWTFTAHVTDPLPFELVERFIIEARARLASPAD
jgi:hypothetical protein